MANMVPDWAYLPEGLVTVIAVKLSTNVDYVRLRAVCKGWRRDVAPSSSHLPRQTPWLMLPQLARDVNNERVGKDFDVLSFYDPYQSKFHNLFVLPQCHRATFIHGSSYGWLVLEHDNRVWLYNPINRREIGSLPPLSSPISDVERYNLCIEKVFLSCNPSNTGDFIVVAWFRHGSIWELGFCQIGDPQWTILKMTNVGTHILDFTFHNNLVYTVNMMAEITVYDLQNLAVRIFSFESILDVISQIHLVEGCTESDGILIIQTPKFFSRRMTLCHTFKWNNDLVEWQRVMNITNRAIYLSGGECCNVQSEKEQANRVYWLDLWENSSSVFINWMNLENSNRDYEVVTLSALSIGFPSWFTPILM